MGEMNNTFYVATVAPFKGWDVLGSKGTVSSEGQCIGSRKIDV